MPPDAEAREADATLAALAARARALRGPLRAALARGEHPALCERLDRLAGPRPLERRARDLALLLPLLAAHRRADPRPFALFHPVLSDLSEELLALAAGRGLALEGLAPDSLRRALAGPDCYERVLARADAGRRAALGVYTTPAPIAAALVRAADDLLRARGGLAHAGSWRAAGLTPPAGADPEGPLIRALDPAAGIGCLLDPALSAMLEGSGAFDPTRLCGLEIDPVAWWLAHLRLGRRLADAGLAPGAARLPVFLADALAGPEGGGEEARAAAEFFARHPVTVALANPPYERLSRAALARLGGLAPLLADLREPARRAGAGAHLKNLHNLYVYFLRWLTARVFEAQPGPAVLCAITPASFLRGPGFVGLREHLRRVADEVHALDLEGDPRAPRPSENVFAGVSAPVAITALARPPRMSGETDALAPVRCARLAGDAQEKLRALAGLRALSELRWRDADAAPGAPFAPARGEAPAWPRLVDLLPWQHSGAQFKRTWPIAPDPETLLRRWEALLAAGPEERRALFRETAARPASALGPDEPPPPIVRYAFRAHDRQWCLFDARLADRLRPTLWRVRGPRQRFLTALLTSPLGEGPAAALATEVPDLHHVRGSFGGKDVVPLWRDAEARVANVNAAALARLNELSPGTSAEDLFDYTYAALAGPGYAARLDLREPGPRVPLSADPALLARGAALGRALAELQSVCPEGQARCLGDPSPPVPPDSFDFDAARGELRIGDAAFAPVDPALWRETLGGRPLVASWISERLPARVGHRRSGLDAIRPRRWTAAFSEELLALLWTLEHTLALRPDLDAWLAEVLAGPLLSADELPPPLPAERRPPVAE